MAEKASDQGYLPSSSPFLLGEKCQQDLQGRWAPTRTGPHPLPLPLPQGSTPTSFLIWDQSLCYGKTGCCVQDLPIERMEPCLPFALMMCLESPSGTVSTPVRKLLVFPSPHRLFDFQGPKVSYPLGRGIFPIRTGAPLWQSPRARAERAHTSETLLTPSPLCSLL